MQLRDRTLKLHTDAAVMEASASNIPAATAEFREGLLTSGRTRPHFRVTINVSERGAALSSCHDSSCSRAGEAEPARPSRDRVSGFTWDIFPSSDRKSSRCTGSTGHIGSCALRLCTMHTFPRLSSRDRRRRRRRR